MMELRFRKSNILDSIKYLTFNWAKNCLVVSCFIRVPCNCCSMTHLNVKANMGIFCKHSSRHDSRFASYKKKKSTNALTASTPSVWICSHNSFCQIMSKGCVGVKWLLWLSKGAGPRHSSPSFLLYTPGP